MTRRSTYTPTKTRAYEQLVRSAAIDAMAETPPLAGPVKVVAQIELQIPSSWPARKISAAIIGEVKPISRPDLDNCLKTVFDACSGIVFNDDAQIVTIEAWKRYSLDPKIVLTISPLSDEVRL